IRPRTRVFDACIETPNFGGSCSGQLRLLSAYVETAGGKSDTSDVSITAFSITSDNLSRQLMPTRPDNPGALRVARDPAGIAVTPGTETRKSLKRGLRRDH